MPDAAPDAGVSAERSGPGWRELPVPSGVASARASALESRGARQSAGLVIASDPKSRVRWLPTVPEPRKPDDGRGLLRM